MPASQALQIETNVAVPMRDGTILYADLYRPEGPGPYPVLLQRTPYDKGVLWFIVLSRACRRNSQTRSKAPSRCGQMRTEAFFQCLRIRHHGESTAHKASSREGEVL